MPRFSTTPVSDIRKMDVEAWFSTLPLSRGTATNILTEFRAIMEYALENELIKRNPARGVLLPVKMRAPARTAPYTIDEARTILAALHGSDRLMIAIMLFCGVRPGEVLALRCGDVNDPFLVIDESTDGGGRYKATKTRRTRYVAIPSGLLAQLRAHVASSTGEPDEPLFPGQHNRALWTVGGFLRHIGRALNGRIAGFNLRRLRATCATYLDADVADRRDLLGHTSETTTLNHYISGVPERQIAAVDRLEKQFVN
jgi:integrase